MLIAISLMLFAGAAPDQQASKAFTARVGEYVKLRQSVVQKIGPLPKSATPEQIAKYDKSLAQALQAARANARQGDIFASDIRPLFEKALKENLAGAENTGNRQMAKQGNPKHDTEAGEVKPTVRVNAVYPRSAPVSTMPPLLLLQLPQLPKDIEYRFVGKTLVLYDSLSNLIIDYIGEAAPGL